MVTPDLIRGLPSLNLHPVEPLLVFIAKVRAWHVFTVGAYTLLFVIVSYLTDGHTMSRAEYLPLAIHSLVTIPVLIFTLAFLAFASFTRDFGALALFPSIFLVVVIFAAVAIVGFGMEDPDFTSPIFVTLGLTVSLLFSSLLCGMIAIRRNSGR